MFAYVGIDRAVSTYQFENYREVTVVQTRSTRNNKIDVLDEDRLLWWLISGMTRKAIVIYSQ